MWYRLFPGRAECVWKLLSCGCVMAGTSQGLGGVAANDHTPDSRPSSSMCCVKSGGSSGLCRWDVLYWFLKKKRKKKVVVDAYQSSNVSLWWICEVSVRVAFKYFCPSNSNGGYCPPPKVKWTPMSGGGDRGDDGLGIRKYWVEVVFRYFFFFCPTVSDVCHRANLH